MKGLALETIGFILIALFGVVMLLLFISGSLNDLTRNAFCYFYQNILSKSSNICKPKETVPEQITLRPESEEDLARYIAAYSILCWKDATKSLKTKDTNCYDLFIEYPNDFDKVSESDVTKVLEEEGGCEVLENKRVIDEDGHNVKYSGNCGDENNLYWDVKKGRRWVIGGQNLILIKYDDLLKRVVVKG